MGNRAGSSPVARIKKQVTHWGWLAFLTKEQDLNLTNAMQTRIAGDGWTEPLHNALKSCCPHQTNIIRTKFPLWEAGSDYLFSLAGSRKPISETVLSSDQNQSPEACEKETDLGDTVMDVA